MFIWKKTIGFGLVITLLSLVSSFCIFPMDAEASMGDKRATKEHSEAAPQFSSAHDYNTKDTITHKGATWPQITTCVLDCGNTVSKVAVTKRDLGVLKILPMEFLSWEDFSMTLHHLIVLNQDLSPPSLLNKESLLSVSKKE